MDMQLARKLVTAHALAVEINTGLRHSRGSMLKLAFEKGWTSKRTKHGALKEMVASMHDEFGYEPSPSITRALRSK